MRNTILFISLIILFSSCNKKKEIEVKPSKPKEVFNFPILKVATSPLEKDTVYNQEYSKEIKLIKGFFKEKFSARFSGQFLVVKDNKILFEQLNGYADFTTKTPMTDEVPIHIASTSKPFTAMAILKLVEAKKIKLSDSLTQFFPKFPYPGVTIQTLLNHRSGLPNYLYFTDDTANWPDKRKYLSNQDVIQIMIDKKPAAYAKPDTRFAYCNTNYVLLASVVEKVTKTPFHKVIKEMIFKPLKMKNSFVFQLKDTATVYQSHDYKARHWPYNFHDGVVGDKNVYSTAKDLAKWHQALLSKDIISKKLKKAAFTPYSFERPGIKNYGLGFRMFYDEKYKDKFIFHNGLWHGNNACFVHLPSQKIAIIALGNKYTRLVYQAMTVSGLFGDYPLAKPEINPEDSLKIDSVIKDFSKKIKKIKDTLKTQKKESNLEIIDTLDLKKDSLKIALETKVKKIDSLPKQEVILNKTIKDSIE